MATSQLDTAMAALTPKEPLFCPHKPGVRQTIFLLLDELEAMYGGAAGGGKSDALLMMASQYADVPGYAALLLRRTYAELAMPGALMDRSHQWWAGHPHGPVWNGSEKQWTFPSGASIQFGHIQHEVDKYRYQSAEFQLIGFDEATEFTETQYTFLISRCRRLSSGPTSTIPLRVRAASNPGGIGHAWVKSRFIPEVNAAGQRALKYDSETGQLRPFVPARIRDNPHLDQESYIASLKHLDPVTRERLLNGDWDVQVGGMFSRLWFPIVPSRPLPNTVKKRARYWDLAATEEAPGKDPDYTAGLLHEFDNNHDLYLSNMIRGRWSPFGVEQRIIQTAQADGRNVPIYIEQEPGSGSIGWIDTIVRKLAGYVVVPMPSRGDKAERAAPLASYAEAGHVKLVEGPWILDFLAEYEAFDPVTNKDLHDDQVDAGSGGFHVITAYGDARSYSTLPKTEEAVVRKGDLVLKGDRYIDEDPVSIGRG